MMIKRCLIVCSPLEGSRGAFQRTPEIRGGGKKYILQKCYIAVSDVLVLSPNQHGCGKTDDCAELSNIWDFKYKKELILKDI